MQSIRIPFLVSLGMLGLLGFVSMTTSVSESNDALLSVTFLDVGQGDALLIESPTGTQVLIDGGKGDVVRQKLKQEMGFWDRDIDMVVATHPDADHIEGLIGVLEYYTVHTILMTENINDTPVYASFLKSVEQEGAQIIYARTGQIYDLGYANAGSTTLRILFPDYDPTNLESNLSSIVAKLVYGETEFLLTGDSPQEIEEYLVARHASGLQSDVLKVGHHGSRTSTSEHFIQAVSPVYAIISAGKDNAYGHPHKEVVALLTAANILQKNTADEGSIQFVSDGVTLWLR